MQCNAMWEKLQKSESFTNANPKQRISLWEEASKPYCQKTPVYWSISVQLNMYAKYFSEAESILKQYQQNFPEEGDAFFKEAELMFYRFAYDNKNAPSAQEVEKKYQGLLKKYPQSFVVQRSAGAFYTAVSKFEHALPLLENALQNDPNNYSTLRNLVIVYNETGSYGKAANTFAKAYEVSENAMTDIDILFSVCAAYLRMGKPEEAQRLLNFVFSETPELKNDRKLQKIVKYLEHAT